MLGSAEMRGYTRREVCRMLSISERQLQSWEKQSLIPRLEAFAFSDLIAIRTLVKLREDRVPPAQIRRALTAVREKLSTVSDPLRELKIFSDGKRITVQVEGGRMDPISGQLLLDFDRAEIHKMLAFPQQKSPQGKAEAARRFEALAWFDRALELEQRGAPLDDVVGAYKKSIELDPNSAGALVNLGTIYFHLRSWDEAERNYRQALAIDPGYALAHFNLGNLFDEKGDRSQALLHYMMAVRLNPGYGDAHYNLALLYQSSGQALRAVRHWKAYLKLDATSPWAVIARQELDKLQRATIVKGSKAKTWRSDAESVS